MERERGRRDAGLCDGAKTEKRRERETISELEIFSSSEKTFVGLCV